MKDRRVATGALAVGAALGVAGSSEAATFNVTNTLDTGAGSLRQAVDDANSNAGADTITFDASLSGSTITLASGEMLISDTVDIQGLGSANLTVDANEASRVFYVYNPSPVPIDVTISGITFVNGYSVVSGDPPLSSGGTIRVLGENLALDDVHIENSSAGGDGGAIAFAAIDSLNSYNLVSSVLSIQRSTLSGNFAEVIDVGQGIDQGGCGGAVFAGGVYNVQLDEVTLANNRARCNGGGLFAVLFQDGGALNIQNSVITGNNTGEVESGSGGGVAMVNYESYAYGSSATITDTTISGNDAVASGGGVYASYMSNITLARTTISGNTAQSGGGVMAYYAGMTLENCTVAENGANGWGGGVYALYDGSVVVKETTVSGNMAVQDGPGLYAYAGSHFDVVNSIVANNGAGADLADDGYTSDFNVAYTLVENEGTATVNDGGGNVIGVDPQLGALQDNGGPTFTMKPASTSPAVNVGDPAFTPPPTTDQRGFARVVNGTIDMGAVELSPGTLQFSLASQNVNENAGTATVTVTRTGGFDGAASVSISVDGTSTATGGGNDYTFAGAVANFADNDSTPQSFNITIVDDPTVEPSETIILNLGANTGAPLGVPATHTVTILDNDVAPPPSADLSITKAAVPGPVTQGSNVTFTITVTNNGPDAAANVVVTDTLPPQLTYVSATPSTGSCSFAVNVTCNLGTLNPSASATISLVATMTGTGPATNVATVASDTTDNDPTDNGSQATITIQAAAPNIAIPALDPRMQLVLAALVAAIAVAALKR